MIKIVTDSSSDISPSLAAELDITVMPLRINFGTKVYSDGVDIDRVSFYRYLSKSTVLPIAAPPPLEEFQRLYERLLKDADQILAIHVSSRINKTVQVAQEAARTFLGRDNITVVDSRVISWGLELLVTAAVEAAQRGASVEEIVRLIRGMIPHIYIIFFTETLDYLEHSTHPGKGRLLTDSLPGAKPLLMMEDGEIMSMEKIRTRGKSIDRLFEFVAEFARVDRITVLQGRSTSEAQALLERLTELFPKRKVDIKPYGPTLATYLGPDALGVVVYEGS